MIPSNGLLSRTFLIAMATLMALPIAATAINAFAADWSDTLLPSALTADYFLTVIADPRFTAAMVRSLAVAAVALALATVLIVPAIVCAHIYWPALDRWLARLVILPYAVPAIVLVVGYLRVFSHPPLQINGSPLVLVLVYVPVCFPMFYIAIKNSLRGLAIVDLLDAGRLVGASDAVLLRRVILPSIVPGIMVAAVLNFAILFSEFVYAKMLVGGNFETLQMYMYAQRNLSGRITSVIVLIYFVLLLVMTLASLGLARTEERASR
ncbi:putative spermidine/putrescine transport system permease protein [Pseudochelatococcus lubricantis]|uniref:Spermidine/putrescine transport system permease protein n=1 Tax=Pseudochelatococcus lubricantis TaxID=1538102 RepID=A0ABX0V172_9HYPH|nr:ABC transporter permease subunit [Pseudochelatococcus lubricantis]NIJ58952.1 putative spermidine/putrescine transport system permease protein [Pseudochelatococcus lubricantis]